MANVTRSRAGQMVWEPWFPAYVEAMDMGTIWDEKEVAAALAAQGYPRGTRPRPLAEVQAA
jgi:hypothetical protein